MFPLLAHSTAGAFDIVCRLDRNDTLDEVRQNNKQKVATGLLLDKLHKLGSAGLLSSRASRALGPISRYRAAGARFCWAYFPSSFIELRTSCLMKIVSRASRPELTVGVIRILCNGLCTAQRFHTEEHDDTCRVGCPMNLTLSQITTSVSGCTTDLLLAGDMLLYFHGETMI